MKKTSISILLAILICFSFSCSKKPATLPTDDKTSTEQTGETDTGTENFTNTSENNSHDETDDNIIDSKVSAAAGILGASIDVSIKNDGADELADAVVTNNKEKIVSDLSLDFYGFSASDFDYFDNTEFNGYKIYPLVYDGYASGEALIQFNIVSTDSPIFKTGSDILLYSVNEYGEKTLSSPFVSILENEYSSLDKGILTVCNALYNGVFLEPKQAEDIDYLAYFDDFLHRIATYYEREYAAFTIEEINDWFSAHISGFSPFSSVDLANFIVPDEHLNIYGITKASLGCSEDDLVFGCILGHGLASVYTSVSSINGGRGILEVSFTAYADPSRLLPVSKSTFIFDVTDETPVFKEVVKEKYSDKEAYVF